MCATCAEVGRSCGQPFLSFAALKSFCGHTEGFADDCSNIYSGVFSVEGQVGVIFTNNFNGNFVLLGQNSDFIFNERFQFFKDNDLVYRRYKVCYHRGGHWIAEAQLKNFKFISKSGISQCIREVCPANTGSDNTYLTFTGNLVVLGLFSHFTQGFEFFKKVNVHPAGKGRDWHILGWIFWNPAAGASLEILPYSTGPRRWFTLVVVLSRKGAANSRDIFSASRVISFASCAVAGSMQGIPARRA